MKHIYKNKGISIIEVIMVIFLTSTALVPLFKMVYLSKAYLHSAVKSSMSLSLAQEALENIRYLKDSQVNNNPKLGWENFYNNLLIENPNIATLNGSTICDGEHTFRFLHPKNTETSTLILEEYGESLNQQAGKLILFEEETDIEIIKMQNKTQGAKEPFIFKRQIICREIGENLDPPRPKEEVLEFIALISWEEKGNEYQMPLKMELSKEVLIF